MRTEYQSACACTEKMDMMGICTHHGYQIAFLDKIQNHFLIIIETQLFTICLCLLHKCAYLHYPPSLLLSLPKICTLVVVVVSQRALKDFN